MGWAILGIPTALLLALTAFFVVLGFLVLFIEELELKLVVGIGSLLTAGGVGLLAADLPEFSILLFAILGGVITKMLLEYFSVY